MGLVGNLVLYAAVKKNFADRSRIDKGWQHFLTHGVIMNPKVKAN